jgi:hypothetical protein
MGKCSKGTGFPSHCHCEQREESGLLPAPAQTQVPRGCAPRNDHIPGHYSLAFL